MVYTQRAFASPSWIDSFGLTSITHLAQGMEPHQIVSTIGITPTSNFTEMTIRHDLAHWNHHRLGNLETNLSNTLNKISDLQATEASRPLDDREEAGLHSLINKSKAISSQINLKLWTMAKCNWIKNGDCNINFFHRLISHKARINEILSITLDSGETINEDHLISSNFVNFYSNLWKSNSLDVAPSQINYLKSFPFLISIQDNMWESLCCPFSMYEISHAVANLGRGKSLAWHHSC